MVLSKKFWSKKYFSYKLSVVYIVSGFHTANGALLLERTNGRQALAGPECCHFNFVCVILIIFSSVSIGCFNAGLFLH